MTGRKLLGSKYIRESANVPPHRPVAEPPTNGGPFRQRKIAIYC
jgi:hypothetical protein